MKQLVASRTKRIDGVYWCDHKPYVNIINRKVLCRKCPRHLKPTDLNVGQVIQLTPAYSVIEVAVDGDNNCFNITVL